MLTKDKYTIPLQPIRPITEDYERLKALGIEYIQALSKRVWTDFNAHDPGVTTLELLCYALTDLGYRTNFPIADILTEKDNHHPNIKGSFFTANEILKQHPLTIVEYRKLVLDCFPEIKNVWFTPVQTAIPNNIYLHKKKEKLTLDANNSFNKEPLVINGFYNVKIEVHETENENTITKRLFDFLMDHRNLCENFNCVQAIQHEYVGMCMDIDFDGSTDPLLVKKAIYKAMYDYCSPSIKRYTLQQMYEKGKSTEEIFSAYNPKNGFFDQIELENFGKRNILYTSDVINILMDIKGVKNIRKIHFNSYKKVAGVLDIQSPLEENAAYCLHLKNSENSFQFFVDTETETANNINFYYQDLQIHLPELVDKNEIITINSPIIPFVNTLPLPVGKYRELDKYYSIQNEFPNNYYIGQQGISDNETNERKAQRLQFKGYLLHFEQLMSDYLAQLNNVKNLLSWSSKSDYRSYYSQSLSAEEISDLERLKSENFDALFDSTSLNGSYYKDVINVDAEENFDRRNRFLNHLIARFNDSFAEFSIVQFFKLTNNNYQKSSIIADKKSFLRTYPTISADRLKAANYKKEIWNTPNLSGYEMRVAKKLGLTNKITSNPDLVMVHSLVHPVISEPIEVSEPISLYDYSLLPFDQQFGFHIVEHILLKPYTENQLLSICNDADDTNCACKDPYSFKISIVLPGWLPISIDTNFRKYVEQQLREELPAHIAAKICWISPTQMLAFEQAYFGFMNELKNFKVNCRWKPSFDPNKLKDLSTIINNLKNIYPPSHLVECNDIVFDKTTNSISRYPAVLGKVALSKDLKFDINWVTPPENIWEHIKDDDYDQLFFSMSAKAQTFVLRIQNELQIEENSLKIGLSAAKTGTQVLNLPNDNQLRCTYADESNNKKWQFTCFFRLENEANQESDNITIQFQNNEGVHSASVFINKKVKYELGFTAIKKAEKDSKEQFYFELQEPFKKTILLTLEKVKKINVYSRDELEKFYLTKNNLSDPSQFKLPIEKIKTADLADNFFKQIKKMSVKKAKK